MTSKLDLYNRALRALGERTLVSASENVPSRYALDAAWDGGFLRYVLEQGQWNFAIRSVELGSDPDIATGFGYTFGFNVPEDWVRTVGLCTDEFFNCPLERVMQEGSYWYADTDPIYLRYVSDDSEFGGDYSLWPETFTKWASLHLAEEVCGVLTASEQKMDRIKKDAKRALTDARSKDAMNDPTTFPPAGRWQRARRGGFFTRHSGRDDRGSRSELIAGFTFASGGGDSGGGDEGGGDEGGGDTPVLLSLDNLNATSQASLVGAWSFRRLRTDYVGPLVRIRRNADSVEQDFGSGLDDLSDTEVQTFLSGSSGFVTTIYDQFGANNLIQATASAQPAYSATAIGSKPGCDFNGSAHFMTANGIAVTFAGSDKPMTLQWVGKNDTYTGTDTMWSFARSTSSNPFFLMQDNANAAIQLSRRSDSGGGDIVTAATGVIMIPGDKVYTARFTGLSLTTVMNGNPMQGHSALAMNVGTCTFDRFSIGARVSTSTTNFMDGKISEVVAFSADIGSAETEVLNGDARDYYGAPIMGLFGQTTSQQLPDALTGSDVGKGFTCTGLTRDKQDNTSWWVCNFGAATPADITYEPSLVKISADGSTKLDEIALLSLYPGMSAGSFQDVTEDTTTHTLWIASSGEGRVRRLTKAGVDTGDVFVLSGVSGIAYDELRDTLWCTTGTKLREYSKVGALLTEIETGFADADQVFYDAVNDLVWVSESDEPSPLVVYSYRPTTAAFGEYIYRLASSQAGEGFDITGTTITIVNDGYYHDNTPPTNMLQTYTRVL